jgi:hypothetical protein
MNNREYTQYRKLLAGDVLMLDALHDLKHWESMRAKLQKEVNIQGFTETMYKGGIPVGDKQSAAYLNLKIAQDKCDALRKQIGTAIAESKAKIKPKPEPGSMSAVKNF